MHRHRHAQEGVRVLKLLADETERDVVEARAAQLFGQADAEQVQLICNLPYAFAVLRKLQMSNRYELSRWAADRRLV